jgi:hypothetical protein
LAITIHQGQILFRNDCGVSPIIFYVGIVYCSLLGFFYFVIKNLSQNNKKKVSEINIMQEIKSLK